MDQRVLKSAIVGGNERHTVEVFGSLRLNHAGYDVLTNDYERTVDTEAVYLGGLGRLVYAPGKPSLEGKSLHVFLELGDHLGSTSVVIDAETSELVERSTFQPHGAAESDYRPARWGNFREDYKFTGKEEDVEVGLTYFGGRYLHSRLGRWTSADPLTIHSLGADLNPYAYVHGRLSTAVDPWGLADAAEEAADKADPSKNYADHGGWGYSVQTGEGNYEIIDRSSAPASATPPADFEVTGGAPQIGPTGPPEPRMPPGAFAARGLEQMARQLPKSMPRGPVGAAPGAGAGAGAGAAVAGGLRSPYVVLGLAITAESPAFDYTSISSFRSGTRMRFFREEGSHRPTSSVARPPPSPLPATPRTPPPALAQRCQRVGEVEAKMLVPEPDSGPKQGTFAVESMAWIGLRV